VFLTQGARVKCSTLKVFGMLCSAQYIIASLGTAKHCTHVTIAFKRAKWLVTKRFLFKNFFRLLIVT